MRTSYVQVSKSLARWNIQYLVLSYTLFLTLSIIRYTSHDGQKDGVSSQVLSREIPTLFSTHLVCFLVPSHSQLYTIHVRLSSPLRKSVYRVRFLCLLDLTLTTVHYFHVVVKSSLQFRLPCEAFVFAFPLGVASH